MALWVVCYLVICSWTAFSAVQALAQLEEGNPRLSLPPSHLDEPFESTVFLTGYISYGGGFRDLPGDIGYGGTMVFTPGSPPNIFSAFLGWNATMVVQVDYLEIPDGGSSLSGDLILRHYFGKQDGRKSKLDFFLGLGSGVSQIRLPDPSDVAEDDYWSLMVEAGQDWNFKPGFLFFAKGQYRWMINAGRTYQTWTFMAGLGIALPG